MFHVHENTSAPAATAAVHVWGSLVNAHSAHARPFAPATAGEERHAPAVAWCVQPYVPAECVGQARRRSRQPFPQMLRSRTRPEGNARTSAARQRRQRGKMPHKPWLQRSGGGETPGERQNHARKPVPGKPDRKEPSSVAGRTRRSCGQHANRTPRRTERRTRWRSR